MPRARSMTGIMPSCAITTRQRRPGSSARSRDWRMWPVAARPPRSRLAPIPGPGRCSSDRKAVKASRPRPASRRCRRSWKSWRSSGRWARSEPMPMSPGATPARQNWTNWPMNRGRNGTAMAAADHLEIAGLCKAYEGCPALCNVSLRLEQGDFLTLLGPNGAGKSTLLRIIATLVLPDRGSVRVRGADLAEDPERFRRRLGFISHHGLFYDHMSAQENLV
ncbi:MAG TPA: ATP-binding cassette domain-containing protein, partial [Desulfobulbus sp.]|nr:ATP-binding cassette domain-containing protein [Desulfobulbus sp.]